MAQVLGVALSGRAPYDVCARYPFVNDEVANLSHPADIEKRLHRLWTHLGHWGFAALIVTLS